MGGQPRAKVKSPGKLTLGARALPSVLLMSGELCTDPEDLRRIARRLQAAVEVLRSSGPFASIDCGRSTGEVDGALLELADRLGAACGAVEHLTERMVVVAADFSGTDADAAGSMHRLTSRLDA